MGLSSEVQKHIKEVLKNAPPGTRSNELVYSESDSKRQHVIITDMMASPNGVFTWTKPNTDPKLDLPMTGLDYWEKFKTFMLTRMGMKPRYFVITVDDRKIVPTEKEPTQINRQKYSKVEEPVRLEDEVESKAMLFYDQGFVFPGGRSTPEPIPPSLCRGSSHLRKPLARYLLHKLESWLRENLATCTSFWGTSLIFDYDGHRFLMLEFDRVVGMRSSWHDYIQGFPVYGEADGKVVAWANFFMDNYNVQIETIDTDIMGWATKLAQVHKEKKYTTRIHWITKDQTDGPTKGQLIITDLCMAIDYLGKSLQFTTYRQLLLWMILPGTDYWIKSEYTKGFGLKDITKSLRRQQCIDDISEISYESYDMHGRSNTLCRSEEIVHVQNTLLHILNGLEYKPGSEKLKNKPSITKLEELAGKLWWHIGYWEMNWGISLDIIKRCQEKHNNKNKQKITKAKANDDKEMTLVGKNLIAPLIPPLAG